MSPQLQAAIAAIQPLSLTERRHLLQVLSQGDAGGAESADLTVSDLDSPVSAAVISSNKQQTWALCGQFTVSSLSDSLASHPETNYAEAVDEVLYGSLTPG